MNRQPRLDEQLIHLAVVQFYASRHGLAARILDDENRRVERVDVRKKLSEVHGEFLHAYLARMLAWAKDSTRTEWKSVRLHLKASQALGIKVGLQDVVSIQRVWETRLDVNIPISHAHGDE